MTIEAKNPDRQIIESLEKRIKALQKAYADLEKRCDAQEQTLTQECAFRNEQEEELRLADVIIDKSPVILFRRMAGDDPKLVYVSRNIAQWGYEAEDFLEDRIFFKDIVVEDDNDRLGKKSDRMRSRMSRSLPNTTVSTPRTAKSVGSRTRPLSFVMKKVKSCFTRGYWLTSRKEN